MVPFNKPNFTFPFDLDEQIDILRAHKERRAVPDKTDDALLICTWNVANMGLHARTDDHYRIIAEMMSWFDIIAVQEVHDNLEGLYKVEQFIGTEYNLVFTDRSGNDERAAYFFDANKVDQLQMVGELAVPPKDHRYIKIKGVDSKFTGFDRNPFIVTFKFIEQVLMLINVHLYFGSKSKKNKDRRALEAYAIGRYTHLRRDDEHAFTPNIIALGDFNIPKVEKGDSIYDALVKRGLTIPEYSTKEGATIQSMNQYDQVAFIPGLKRKMKLRGVFDYDKAIFPDLWNVQPDDFHNYCKYYISDHRPLWTQFKFT